MNLAPRLVFPKSPFFPRFDQETITAQAVHAITTQHIDPAPAIALTIYQLMASHILLLSQQADVLLRFATQAEDLLNLDLGFQFPLQTIMASASCAPYPESDRVQIFETLVLPTHNFRNLRAQEQMKEDLRATINLLNLDPSGAYLFQFLADYPLVKDEYYMAGHEIAATIFFGGISQSVSTKLPHLTWLTVPIPDPNRLD